MRRLMPSSAVLALCLAAAPGAGLASNPQRAMQDAPPPASVSYTHLTLPTKRIV